MFFLFIWNFFPTKNQTVETDSPPPTGILHLIVEWGENVKKTGKYILTCYFIASFKLPLEMESEIIWIEL